MKSRPVKICFVCLGNICRSPTAEGVMRRLVESAALADRVEVESAGTAGHHVGERADRRARTVASARGIALESRAQRFDATDFERFDYILAMDRENLAALEALRGAADIRGEMDLLRHYDASAPKGAEVPDPYYGGEAGFEEVLDLCEAACRGLLEHIREHHVLD